MLSRVRSNLIDFCMGAGPGFWKSLVDLATELSNKFHHFLLCINFKESTNLLKYIHIQKQIRSFMPFSKVLILLSYLTWLVIQITFQDPLLNEKSIVAMETRTSSISKCINLQNQPSQFNLQGLCVMYIITVLF